MRRRTIVIGIAGLLLAGAAKPVRQPKAPERPERSAEWEARFPTGTMVFFACQPGQRTLDGSVSAPGNPFATAFISTLSEPGLDLQEFGDQIYVRTQAESRGFQRVDSPRAINPSSLPLTDPANKRVALVMVVSDYLNQPQLPKLPGARHDAERVAAALTAAGYDTFVALDLDRPSIETQLAQFAERARSADVALIYTTGHGLEIGGEPYILMRDFDLADGPDGLRYRALAVSAIAAFAKAKTANLVLSAACRDNPGNW